MSLVEEYELKRALWLKKIIRNRELGTFVRYATPEFSEPTHLQPIVDALTEIAFDGVKKNICISAPPQHFKTTTLQHFIALYLVLKPTANIVYMSYNETLASQRVLEIIKILERLGIKPDPRQSTKTQYWTLKGGKITAAGVDAGFTGRAADLIIIDDPHKNIDEVRSPAMMQRLINVFKGVVETREQDRTSVIVTHTRWSKGDMIGWILDNRKKYQSINIPVINDGEPLLPSILGLNSIEEIRDGSPDVFLSMYMGQPPNSMSSVFRSELNGVTLPKYYTEKPNEFDSVAIGGDLAYTDKTRADYTVYVLMYKNGSKIYIEHAERWQQDFLYTRGRIKQVYDDYQIPFELEYNGVQKGIVETLENDGIAVNRQDVTASKYSRSLDFASEWNRGNVYIKKADWNQWFLDEVLSFTGSGKEHDDIVDACVYAYRGVSYDIGFA